MVAVVSGSALGVELSSAFVLGSRGSWGSASYGRAGENVLVNAATGNLFVHRNDEMLIGRGTDAIVGRTYNSRGGWAGETDNWRPTTMRSVRANADGSLTRSGWDGSEAVYTLHNGKYRTTAGAGPHDTITTATSSVYGNVWIWEDGATGATEFYTRDPALNGRILTARNSDTEGLTFTYEGDPNNLTGVTITTHDGATTKLKYTGGNLTEVETLARRDSHLATTAATPSTRVRYEYDTANRLKKVIVDLTPHVATDSDTYWIEYGYVGTTGTKLAWISQSDTSRVDFKYVGERISSVEQTTVTGTLRKTEFFYTAATESEPAFTVVRTADGDTKFTYDAAGQLTELLTAANQKTLYEYNVDGDVTAIIEANNYRVDYTYDGNGNWLTQADSMGNLVERVYNSDNLLLTEVKHLALDPDGSGPATGHSVTSRYVYEGERHLRFEISDEGRVTEYRYSSGGQITHIIDYTRERYTQASYALADLTGWVSNTADDSAVVRKEYGYDFRDQLNWERSYSSYTTSGAASSGSAYTLYYYVYDQFGSLIGRGPSRDRMEVMVYDGLGRLRSTVDLNNNSTSILLNDTNKQMVVTLATDAIETTNYNRAGEVTSFSRTATGLGTSVTYYGYDQAGRLIWSKNPSGVKSHHLYDNIGRKVADVAGDGALTEYRYDANNRLVSTIRYATAIALNNGELPASTLAELRPAITGARREWRIYDAMGRLIETIDAAGAAVVYEYDRLSRLVSTTAFANRLTTLEENPTTLKLPQPDPANDRVARRLYDDDGLLVATLDGEGGLAEYFYDGARQLTQTIRYFKAVAADKRTEGLAALRASAGTTAGKDIYHWYLYDSQGALRAQVDGEGYLTRYAYSVTGYRSEEVRGQKLDPAALLATPPTLSSLPAAAATATLEKTNWTHDDYGRIVSETKTLTGGATEKTTFEYNKLGLLEKAFTDTATQDRGFSRRYDALGRLTGELSGEGFHQLQQAGADPASVYTNWGTTYGYDAADRMIWKRVPDGNGASVRALYFYDEQNRLRFEVNPQREIVEYRYSAKGDRSDVIRYGTAMSATSLSAFTGGLVTSAFQTQIDAITDVNKDSRLQFVYNADGTLERTIDAASVATTYTYNAFRERHKSTTALTATTSVEMLRLYDRRGLLTSETVDSPGLNLKTSFGYDALGRAVSTVDARNVSRLTGYDRAGRVISIGDGTGRNQTLEYDDRGNLWKTIDRTGAETKYEHDAFSRTITVTTPELLVTTMRRNAYGQTISVTDPANGTTTFDYDRSGNLTKVTDTTGAVNYSYDQRGRLQTTIDKGGIKTLYVYDAADRLVRRTVDPEGLALSTVFVFDARGQQIEVKDPTNSVTKYEFDLNGRMTAQVVDANGAAVRTETKYDRAGRIELVREGVVGGVAARETGYTYDKAGRLTKETVDPNGTLKLATHYYHDGAGNIVARKDAAGHTTRFVYDANNRRILSVDAEGSVVRTTYDHEGRVIQTRAYTNRIDEDQITKFELTEAEASVTAITGDRINSYVYDKDGRVRFAIGPSSRVTGYYYDARGNVIRSVDYGTATPRRTTVEAIEQDIASAGLDTHANTRTRRAVYDAAGRMAFAIDATGAVTRYTYDPAGNVVQERRYAAGYTVAGDRTLADMESWSAGAAQASDRVSRTLYDGLGRVAYAADAEGYVDAFEYDRAGRTTARTRYSEAYTSFATVAALQQEMSGRPGTSITTRFEYDTAGRLTSVIDGENIRTRMELDALGRITRTIVADGTADASTTYRIFDAAGRLKSETRADGETYAAKTSYGYDGVGRVTSVTDPRNFTTTMVYDDVGRVETVTVPLTATESAVTENEYDSFGNLVRVKDPRGHQAFFYYDVLDRLSLQVDPEGYATRTTYTIGDEVATVIRYAVPLSGAMSVGTAPAVTTSAGDATTSFARDKLGRLLQVRDAGGFTEDYKLDAFGDRVEVRNKLNATTYNEYDRRGLLKKETLPVTSVTAAGVTQSVTEGGVTRTAVVNTYAYDSRGNRIESIEAAGFAEERVTTYGYDKADRLVQVLGEEVVVVTEVETNGQVSFASATVRPKTEMKYDARGNVIETIDPAGARVLAYYDDANRRVAELRMTHSTNGDAMGTFSKWTYDGNGNVVSARVYEQSVALPAAAGGAAPNATGAFRETTYGYDRNNRLITTTVAQLRTGAGWPYADATANAITQYAYDAAGNLIEEIDPLLSVHRHYWDKAGRKVAEVDREGYVTLYARDGEGNVTKEERFADRFSGTLPVATGAGASGDPVQALQAGLGQSDARITDFTYDKNGRRLSETRRGVVSHTLDADGNADEVLADAKIEYLYNGLGQIRWKKEATGEATTYSYDSLGRQTLVEGALYTGFGGTSRRRTASAYDGLGNLTRSAELSRTGVAERVTGYVYGAGGRLESLTDATGFTRSFAYDAAGRVVRESYDRKKSDGTFAAEAIGYRYDAAGRLTLQGALVKGANDLWTRQDRTEQRYNAFGELSARGVNGSFAETFSYDKAGRLWRSTEGDGAVRLYLYDLAGNRTLTIASAGADLSTHSVTTILNALTSNGTKTVGTVDVTGVVLTVDTYDKRGSRLASHQPFRELAADSAKHTISSSRTYNAYGEVWTETDARNNVTIYAYNKMGRLVETEKPGVHYTNEQGAASTAPERPKDHFFYDISGRLIGTKDANARVNTRMLLVGSGYGGEEAKAIAEFHADGGKVVLSFDEYGDMRRRTDEVNRQTTYEYDKVGRLTATLRDSSILHEYYEYDGLGQRIAHWNSQLGSGVRERTDYDAQGRVVSQVDFAGRTTSYAHSWISNLATGTFGTFGGWEKVTTTAFVDGNFNLIKSREKQDYFGRTVGRTDLGGHVYSYDFDAAGRVTRIASTGFNGQGASGDTTYTYYNSGLVHSVVEWVGDGHEKTFYSYDKAGNRTGEVFGRHDLNGQTSYRNATITYDAAGRVTRFRDTGGGGDTTVDYEYDLVGNVRRTLATFRQLAGNGGTWTTTLRTQDLWYKYDAMNRVTTAGGALLTDSLGSRIVRGKAGTDIAYNAAGERRHVTTTVQASKTVTNSGGGDSGGDVHVTYWKDADRRTYYSYDRLGRLEKESVAFGSYDAPTAPDGAPAGSLRVHHHLDGMGRETVTTTHNGDGSVDATTIRTFSNTNELLTENYSFGTISRTTTYSYEDAPGRYIGVLAKATTTEGSATSTRTSQYQWWDRPELAGVSVTSSSVTSSSTYTLDGQGRAASIAISDTNGTTTKSRNVSFVTDAEGRVVSRHQATVGEAATPHDEYFYLGRDTVGSVTTEATVKNGVHIWSDFDRSDAGAIARAGEAPATWTVRDGDSLRTVAEALWGDAGLWYLIAEANGLNGTETLAAGTSLIVPAGVSSARNAADTFRVYDPNKALGNNEPVFLAPPKPAHNGGCGIVGKIIVIAIAVAITAIVAPQLIPALSKAAGAIGFAGVTTTTAAATAGTTLVAGTVAGGVGIAAGSAAAIAGGIAAGALAGAAASFVSQGVGVAIGVQDKISWKGVALSAISGGVSGGLGAMPGFGSVTSSAFVNGAIRGTVGNVATQGIAVAAKLQKKFDWAGVAVAGIVSGVSSELSHMLPEGPMVNGVRSTPSQMNLGLSGAGAAFAGAAARSALTGTSFGDNLIAVLPDVIGATIGNAVAGAVNAQMQKAAEEKARAGSTSVNNRALFEAGRKAFMTDVSLGPVDVWSSPAAAEPEPVEEIVVTGYRSRSGSARYGENADQNARWRAEREEASEARVLTYGSLAVWQNPKASWRPFLEHSLADPRTMSSVPGLLGEHYLTTIGNLFRTGHEIAASYEGDHVGLSMMTSNYRLAASATGEYTLASVMLTDFLDGQAALMQQQAAAQVAILTQGGVFADGPPVHEWHGWGGSNNMYARHIAAKWGALDQARSGSVDRIIHHGNLRDQALQSRIDFAQRQFTREFGGVILSGPLLAFSAFAPHLAGTAAQSVFGGGTVTYLATSGTTGAGIGIASEHFLGRRTPGGYFGAGVSGALGGTGLQFVVRGASTATSSAVTGALVGGFGEATGQGVDWVLAGESLAPEDVLAASLIGGAAGRFIGDVRVRSITAGPGNMDATFRTQQTRYDRGQIFNISPIISARGAFAAQVRDSGRTGLEITTWTAWDRTGD